MMLCKAIMASFFITVQVDPIAGFALESSRVPGGSAPYPAKQENRYAAWAVRPGWTDGRFAAGSLYADCRAPAGNRPSRTGQACWHQIGRASCGERGCKE